MMYIFPKSIKKMEERKFSLSQYTSKPNRPHCHGSLASPTVWNEHLSAVLRIVNGYKNRMCDTIRCMGKNCPFLHEGDSEEDISVLLSEIVHTLKEKHKKKKKYHSNEQRKQRKRARMSESDPNTVFHVKITNDNDINPKITNENEKVADVETASDVLSDNHVETVQT